MRREDFPYQDVADDDIKELVEPGVIKVCRVCGARYRADETPRCKRPDR